MESEFTRSAMPDIESEKLQIIVRLYEEYCQFAGKVSEYESTDPELSKLIALNDEQESS